MPRRAFTLIETLLTLGIAGVVLAMLFPAIQRVRESADRMRCASNLRQLTLACLVFHTDRSRFPYSQLGEEHPFTDPPGSHWGPDSKSWSFLARLLPYIEQQPLFRQGRVTEVTLRQSGIASAKIALFLCPSDNSSKQAPRTDAGNLDDFAVGHTNFKGVSGANWGYDITQNLWFKTPYQNPGTNGSYDGKMAGDGILCRNDDERKPTLAWVRDGQSYTFLLGEDLPERNRWLSWPYANNAHGTCAIPPNLTPGNPYVWYASWSFRSRHPGGLQFGFADGSVRWVGNRIDLAAYRALATAAGSEAVELPE